jgi:hypothetical protein
LEIDVTDALNADDVTFTASGGVIGPGQGYMCGDHIGYTVSRRWWEIWADRISSLTWNVAKTKWQRFVVTDTCDDGVMTVQ